jgi:hypothetical protein
MYTASTAQTKVISARGYSLRAIVSERCPVSHQTQTRPLAFNRTTMTLVPGFEEIQAELVAVYNDCDLAQWFSLPNTWLADHTPASVLASAAPEVLIATRTERYVSTH